MQKFVRRTGSAVAQVHNAFKILVAVMHFPTPTKQFLLLKNDLLLLIPR